MCASCGSSLVGLRSDARYCGPTCKRKGYRERRKADIASKGVTYRRRAKAHIDAYQAAHRESNRDRLRAKARDEYGPNSRARSRNYQHLKRSAGGDGFTREEELALLEWQGGYCAYCHHDLGGEYEIEHVTPLSRGGLHDLTNIVLSCRPCNRTKSARQVVDWKPDWEVPWWILPPQASSTNIPVPSS